MIPARAVAKYFLSKVEADVGDGISNLKLQKLVYYAQAYHLAMHGEPLFPEPVEAWEHGPVVPELYREYRAFGSNHIPAPADFDRGEYDEAAAELMDEVYEVFGQYSAWKLRNLTHAEKPWIEAYEEGARGRTISRSAMREFYKDFITESGAGVKRIKHSPDPPSGRIKAGVETSGSTDGVPPVFCLRHLVQGWRISECERDDQAAFAVTAEKLSRLTWQEIRNAPRHGLGTEKIAREAIRSAIPASITEDVQFLAVRFSGLKAMVGFRSREIFHVVWLDPGFRLYDY